MPSVPARLVPPLAAKVVWLTTAFQLWLAPPSILGSTGTAVPNRTVPSALWFCFTRLLVTLYLSVPPLTNTAPPWTERAPADSSVGPDSGKGAVRVPPTSFRLPGKSLRSPPEIVNPSTPVRKLVG